MQTMTLTNDQRKLMDSEVSPMVQKAKSVVVTNTAQKSLAIELVKSMKDLRTRIEIKFHITRNKQGAYKTYQDALDTEKSFYDELDTCVKHISQTVKVYERDVSLKAQREVAEAEAKRQETERKEREKLEAKAQKAEEKGKIEKAAVLREEAETVTAAPVFTPPTEARKLIWKCVVNNPLLACQSIGKGLVPTSVVDFKLSALNQFAKGYDGKTEIPGIRYYQDVNSRIA